MKNIKTKCVFVSATHLSQEINSISPRSNAGKNINKTQTRFKNISLHLFLFDVKHQYIFALMGRLIKTGIYLMIKTPYDYVSFSRRSFTQI
jgi:hypothetical protein